MIRIVSLCVLTVGAVAGCAPAADPAPQAPLRLTAEGGAASIGSSRIGEHVAFLASDELRGRDTPSPGLDRAAEYVANRFADIGLPPFPQGQPYIQRWPYRRLEPDTAGFAVHLSSGAGQVSLGAGDSMRALPSAAGPWEGPVVAFASLSALDAAIPHDLDGRMALVHLPESTAWERVLLHAMGAADRAEAAALAMVVRGPEDLDGASAAARLLADQGLERRVPTFLALASALAPALGGSGTVEEGGDPPPGPTGLTARADLPFVLREAEAPNVLAALPGSDPARARSLVVVTAHLDHIGVGPPDDNGDSIFNGADDNASGVAALLEVAAAMSRLQRAPARTVVFLVPSGEEKGLLGSRHFTDDALGPIDRVVANINLDMVGRNEPDRVYQLGGGYSTLGSLVGRIADQRVRGLQVLPDPDPTARAILRSDHTSFLRWDVPSLFLTSWVHEDYHRPSDRAERVDPVKARRVAELAYWLVLEVADAPGPPTWTADGLGTVRSLLRGGGSP